MKKGEHIKGRTYCRPEMKGKGQAKRTSQRRCPICKFKVRGKNHKQGEHHQKAVRERVGK